MWKWLLIGALLSWLSVAITGETDERIFYLDVQKGRCYLFAKHLHTKARIGAEGDGYKQLIETSCSEPHHLKVIDVVQLPFFHGDGLVGDESPLRDYIEKKLVPQIPPSSRWQSGRWNAALVEAQCVESFKDLMGYSPLSDAFPNATYLRWFYPDDGAERDQYTGTTVCYIHEADTKYDYYEMRQEELPDPRMQRQPQTPTKRFPLENLTEAQARR